MIQHPSEESELIWFELNSQKPDGGERRETKKREWARERKILIGHIERSAFDINHTYEEYENIENYVKISKRMHNIFLPH